MQFSISKLNPGAESITATKPWLIHVNNPGVGSEGPGVYIVNAVGQVEKTNHNFVHDQQDGMFVENKAHVNAPCFLHGIDFQFQFEGYVQNTHIRIDIIRQKRMDTPLWSIASTRNFLPDTLDKLKHIAGFTANDIPKAYFDIIATKKLYLNSKVSETLLGAAQSGADNQARVEATTSNIKHCHMYVPFKKKLNPINATVEEMGLEVNNSDFASVNPFEHTKMHPLSNVWMLISSDDAFADQVNQDKVTCQIIRKVFWRDPVGARWGTQTPGATGTGSAGVGAKRARVDGGGLMSMF
jgi:hypothetical protein